MLSWSMTFLVIGLIAGVLGFTGIAGAATQIAWILFVVFLVSFVVSLRTYELRKNVMRFKKNEDGKVGWILLWALGIPIPVLLILFAIRGCT